MSTIYKAVLTAVTALAALSATAAFAQAQPDPSDASAAVPAVEYESAFNRYRSAPEQDSAADQEWRSANAEVGKLGGHAGHMRDEGAAYHQPVRHNSPSAPTSSGNHHQHHGGGH